MTAKSPRQRDAFGDPITMVKSDRIYENEAPAPASMTFTLSITIPNSLLEVEEAALVSSTLQALARDVHRWQAVPLSRRLRDRSGAVIGWAGTEEADD